MIVLASQIANQCLRDERLEQELQERGIQCCFIFVQKHPEQ